MFWIFAIVTSVMSYIFGLLTKMKMGAKKSSMNDTFKKLEELKNKYEEIDKEPDNRSDIDILRQHRPKQE